MKNEQIIRKASRLLEAVIYGYNKLKEFDGVKTPFETSEGSYYKIKEAYSTINLAAKLEQLALVEFDGSLTYAENHKLKSSSPEGLADLKKKKIGEIGEIRKKNIENKLKEVGLEEKTLEELKNAKDYKTFGEIAVSLKHNSNYNPEISINIEQLQKTLCDIALIAVRISLDEELHNSVSKDKLKKATQLVEKLELLSNETDGLPSTYTGLFDAALSFMISYEKYELPGFCEEVEKGLAGKVFAKKAKSKLGKFAKYAVAASLIFGLGYSFNAGNKLKNTPAKQQASQEYVRSTGTLQAVIIDSTKPGYNTELKQYLGKGPCGVLIDYLSAKGVDKNNRDQVARLVNNVVWFNNYIDPTVDMGDTKSFDGYESKNQPDGIIGDDALIGKKVFYVPETIIKSYNLDSSKLQKIWLIQVRAKK